MDNWFNNRLDPKTVIDMSNSGYMLKGSMKWKGCIIPDCYSVGNSQPYILAVRLPVFHVRRLLSLSTSKPKIVSCRRMTQSPVSALNNM